MMKQLAVVAFAVALSAGAVFAQAAPPAPSDAALPSIDLPPELDRVLRDYETAWRARDPRALAELFAEDGFVLANGRPPVRGRAAIREAYARSGGPLHLRALAFATDVDVGYVIGAYSGAPDAPDDGKFVLALKRGDDRRWLIMADMDNGNHQRRAPAQAPSASPSPRPTPSPSPSPRPTPSLRPSPSPSPRPSPSPSPSPTPPGG